MLGGMALFTPGAKISEAMNAVQEVVDKRTPGAL